jgi:uncharacterized protein (TIGR00251 family)
VIACSEKDGYLSFSVRVVPRASRSEIAGEHSGALRVRIAAPPVDGAANEELIKTLARVLKTPRSAVEIVSGAQSKMKQVRVRGVKESAISALVERAVEGRGIEDRRKG